ncbi:MAG TPA: hypothetical protein VMP01_26530 [Pirellulaceae bacterium]|nr:hypothetical protein [Pirellulaceae bacterium]
MFRRIAWRVLLFSSVILASFARIGRADHPPAPELLPESTLAMVRIADTQQMLEKFRETAMGRMSQDEQIRPLVSQVYSAAQDAWKQIEDRVGVPLDRILKVPQGEICIAVIPMEEGPPGVIALLDTRDQAATAKTLLERGEQLLLENGGSKATETIEQLEVTIYTTPDGVNIGQFEKDGTFVLTTQKALIAPLLKAWDGKPEGKRLSQNEKFVSIMNRCGGAGENRPHVTWYFDPVETARRVLRGTPGALGLALFPVLGIDGIKGVGGSVIFSPGEFDDVMHLHLLLDDPRAGVVDLLQMTGGDTTPEKWVPGDVVSYTTLHWDFATTFDKGAKLFNSLQGDDALQNFVRSRTAERLGIDLEKEVLPLLDGRVTMVNWMEKPIRINSQTNLIGIKLKDPQAAQGLLDKVVEKYIEQFQRKSFGGVHYWMASLPQGQVVGGPRVRIEAPDDGQSGEDRPRPNLRQSEGCLCILGDYLILSDSSAALHQCILTQSDPKTSLANELDYKLIAGKIKRQQGGETAGMVQFSRPEEGMRFIYEMAMGEDARQFLDRRREENPFLRDVDQALKDNPLPPFSVLAKYLAPSGGMMVSDETGIHYMTFTLKRKTQ